jgi:hypothetical protein
MGRSTDTSPAYDGVAITPSDATIIPVTRSIYVGVTGNIAVRMASGNSVTYSNVPVGVFPIQVDMVKSTSTTATTMIAMY